MMALIIFIITIVLLVGLFVVKYIEVKAGKMLFAQNLRTRCNSYITSIELRCAAECTIDNARYLCSKVYNIVTHKFAKVTASIAKKIEWRARSVAHKSAKAKADGEEVRENGFLKDVQEHKDGLDIEEVAQRHKL